MILKFKKLHPEATVPTYGTEHAAAFDLYALEDVTAPSRAVIKTGLAFEIPKGCAMFIKPRSGLAFNQGVEAFQGTIDSDYRGEVKVLLTTSDTEQHIAVKKGDRIAQAIVIPVPVITFQETSELSDTSRGAQGFGHTG
jgi:dUTP pyrophosphatase